MIRSITLVAFICITFSHQVLALGITISERQLNGLINLRFPISHRYLDYQLEASQPSLALFSQTQSVSITARINVINSGNRLTADATFKGELHFDKTSNALKVSNPLITQFTVIENTFPKSETSISSIKSTVGQHLPIAVLIDFSQISNELFQFTPRHLSIVESGLRVEY